MGKRSPSNLQHTSCFPGSGESHQISKANSLLVFDVFSWAGAIWFFVNKSTSWFLSPAESRRLNTEVCECLFLLDPGVQGVRSISPHNIVWRYIVMQLSYHFQNIVKISISLKFWKYHTILEKGYALWNSHFRSTLKAIHSGSCLQCASKIKITWLFAFVKTYLQHELAYFCHF